MLFWSCSAFLVCDLGKLGIKALLSNQTGFQTGFPWEKKVLGKWKEVQFSSRVTSTSTNQSNALDLLNGKRIPVINQSQSQTYFYSRLNLTVNNSAN